MADETWRGMMAQKFKRMPGWLPGSESYEAAYQQANKQGLLGQQERQVMLQRDLEYLKAYKQYPLTSSPPFDTTVVSGGSGIYYPMTVTVTTGHSPAYPVPTVIEDRCYWIGRIKVAIVSEEDATPEIGECYLCGFLSERLDMLRHIGEEHGKDI